jgi:hypothetical protein
MMHANAGGTSVAEPKQPSNKKHGLHRAFAIIEKGPEN